MQEVGITIIDEKDEKLAEGLQNVGLGRVTSFALVGVLRLKDAKARNMEQLTGLRQPEVSIGVRTLIERGWVSESNGAKKKVGKGRPEKIYRLNVPFDKIIADLEEVAASKSKETIEKLLKLKTLAKKT